MALLVSRRHQVHLLAFVLLLATCVVCLSCVTINITCVGTMRIPQNGPITTRFRPAWRCGYQPPFPGMIIPHDDNSDIMLPNASLQPGDLVPYDEEMADAAVARESARVDGGDMRVVSHDDVMPGCARPYRASTMPGSEKKVLVMIWTSMELCNAASTILATLALAQAHHVLVL